MRTKKKTLLIIVCVCLLVTSSIIGSFAYLMDQDKATNTFTVGQVHIQLDETDVKTDGSKDTDARVDGNEYHLLPGHTYIKDPMVTVKANSEDSYVRMKITVENIDQLKAALPNEGVNAKYYATENGQEVFLLQMLVSGWDNTTWVYEKYTESTNEETNAVSGIYEFRYKEIVKKSSAAQPLDPLFDTITVPGEIDNTHIEYLANVKIIAIANAIQADGFDTATKAWTAFDEQVK